MAPVDLKGIVVFLKPCMTKFDEDKENAMIGSFISYYNILLVIEHFLIINTSTVVLVVADYMHLIIRKH